MIRFPRKKSIGRQLLIGFGLVLSLIIASNAFSVSQLWRVRVISAQVADFWLPSVAKSSELATQLVLLKASEFEYLLTRDPGARVEIASDMETATQNLFIYRKAFESLLTSEEDQKSYEQFSTSIDGYLADHEKMIELIKADKQDEAEGLMIGDAAKRYNEASKILKILSDRLYEGGLGASQASGNVYRVAWILILAISVIALLVGLGVAIGINRKISATMAKLVEGMTSAASTLGKNSTELTETGKNLSSSTSSSASFLQQTVSAVEEVSSMVAKNAENAGNSQQVAESCQSAAARGRDAVREMLASIEEIGLTNQGMIQQLNTSNQEISDIARVISEIDSKTKVINDIVFQTKLLSFNASVEAARAGEHGKGFAVVAEEVGNLAQMSGNAAREISSLLDSSLKRVEQIVAATKSGAEAQMTAGMQKIQKGAETAKRCSEALEEIVMNVSHVSQMVNEISTASAEQSTGVKEISTAMSKLDTIVQENAHSAAAAAQTAGSLQTQSELLHGYVTELRTTVQGVDS